MATDNAKYVAKTNVAVGEEQRAKKCLHYHKVESGQDEITLVTLNLKMSF